jgi:hypothetical protein
MVERVPGAAAAARYANTDLYGVNLADGGAPGGWQARALATLTALPPAARKEVALGMMVGIRDHRRRTAEPLPDAAPHPVSGYCWRFLYAIPAAGGNKFDRQQQKVFNMALAERKKRGR